MPETARLHQNGGVVQADPPRNSHSRAVLRAQWGVRPLCERWYSGNSVSYNMLQTSRPREHAGAFPLSGHIGGVSVSHRQKVVWRSVRATMLCAAMLAGSGAWAQIGASVLTGNVVDAATKAPVADVVVTATSPNLQGEQVVVTDSTGLCRIPQLPPGTYTLRFEKESYRPSVARVSTSLLTARCV